MSPVPVLRSLRTLMLTAIILAMIAIFSQRPAIAQDTPDTPDTQLSQKIDALTQLLNDPQLQSALAQPVTTANERLPADLAGIEGALDAWIEGINTHLASMVIAAGTLGPDLMRVSQRFSMISGDFTWIRLWAFASLTIALAFGVERLCRRTLGTAAHHPPRIRDRELKYAVPALVFCITIIFLFFVMPWQKPMRSFALPILIAAMFMRMLVWITRLSSRMADLSVNPRHTQFWERRVIIIGCVMAATYVMNRSFMLLDAPPSTVGLIRYLAGFAIIAIAAASIWTAPARHPDQSATHHAPRLLLTIWLVLLAMFAVMGTLALYYIAALVVLLPIALRIITRIIHGIFADLATEGPQAKRRAMLLVLAERGARALVIGISILWATWRTQHSSSATMMMSNQALDRIAHAIVSFVVVAVLADLAWHALKTFVETRIESSGDAGNSRLRTLLPIFRSIAGVLILTISAMMILSGAGIEIAPLLAGAGIFGVAIGFGSQTLVKDVISGIFYMLDDAFRVGEYIQSGSYKGVVEGFSLRSVRLRHHRGPVYTVPFGSLGAIQNMSRDWSKDKFLITVPYKTDVEKVRKLVKKVGETLLEDPELGPLFIQPLKMKGVESFGEYGISLGVAMIVKPTPLLSMIRRRSYMMIRESFRENGIEFAVPTVNVAGTTDSEAEGAASAFAVRKSQLAKLDPQA